MRLIEILDFTKNKLTYRDKDIFKWSTPSAEGTSNAESLKGPTFRHIYHRLLGPTFPGEYVEPEADSDMGLYVLSYPGVAFTFPVARSSMLSGKDAVSLLSSSANETASSMAIFSGESWPSARDTLFTKILDPVKDFTSLGKGREPVADEVGCVKIHGEGRLELVRPWHKDNCWINLGETTPQALVAELGPPDAIYRKNDQPMSIHKLRPVSETRSRADAHELRMQLQDDSTESDQSSAHTNTDDSEEDSGNGEDAGNVSGEYFYNYFYHGFDVLISTSATPSTRPPSQRADPSDVDSHVTITSSSPRLVAAKLILHGNVPGSYPFNRHRRCRWEIDYLSDDDHAPTNSESDFKNIQQRLHEEWQSIYASPEEAEQRQRGMVLNRDWGDGPGSSCELLGGWEDSINGDRRYQGTEGNGLGNTTLFGFPGLVFEVLSNGVVSGLTVF